MDNTTGKFVPKSARLMDQVKEVLRFHHYAFNTEKSYVSWILQRELHIVNPLTAWMGVLFLHLFLM